MRSATGEFPNLSDSSGVTASAQIQLVPSPSPDQKTANAVSTTPQPREETSFFQQSRSNEQLTALDSLFSQPSTRQARPKPRAGNDNAPNPQAQSSGGAGIGGVSTPNAGGGGSGGPSGGPGPAVTNANQFLSANLNIAGSALTARRASGGGNRLPAWRQQRRAAHTRRHAGTDRGDRSDEQLSGPSATAGGTKRRRRPALRARHEHRRDPPRQHHAQLLLDLERELAGAGVGRDRLQLFVEHQQGSRPDQHQRPESPPICKAPGPASPGRHAPTPSPSPRRPRAVRPCPRR